MNRIHQKKSLEQKIQTLKEDFLVRENNDKDDGRVWVNKYQLVG